MIYIPVALSVINLYLEFCEPDIDELWGVEIDYLKFGEVFAFQCILQFKQTAASSVECYSVLLLHDIDVFELSPYLPSLLIHVSP